MIKTKKRAGCKPPRKIDIFGVLDSEYFGIDKKRQLLLLKSVRWNYDIFTLDRITSGHPIIHLGMFFFEYHNLLTSFKIDYMKFLHTLSLLERNYHQKNPYHNALHAADVTQAMHCYVSDSKIRQKMKQFDFMVSLLGAMFHDVDHPGVNQAFLEKTNNYLSDFYKAQSVLENHHYRIALSILHETKVFHHFTSKQWGELQYRMYKLIMATDIARQNEYLDQFTNFIEQNIGIKEAFTKENKILIMQMALKCADICNPCREWRVAACWANLISAEFFRQGDRERRMNLPLAPTMDRYGITKPKVQTGFIRFLVRPLFNKWNEFMKTRLSEKMVIQLEQNLTRWESKQNQITPKIEEPAKAVQIEAPAVAPIAITETKSP